MKETHASVYFTRAVAIFAFLVIVYHVLYISDAFIYMGIIIQPYLHVTMHMALMLFFVYLLVPAKKGTKRNVPPWYDVIFAVLSFAPPIYQGFFYWEARELIGGIVTPQSVILGLLFILLILEAARRLIGLTFVIILVFFIIYPLIANYLPGFLLGLPRSFDTVVVYMYHNPVGLFGPPVRISATIIIAFLFFGQLLVVSGAGKFFIDLAMGLAGRFRGGPAKIAVLGSMFFGMLSGSSVSNVMTTGVFTIPMMKKIGFRANFAGAVEAAASNGGIYMPPIMGAVIFVLCDYTGIPYVKVMFASFIPAFLYYLALLLMVDFEAAKTRLKGLSASETPPIWKTLKGGYTYFIPLAVLLYLLIVPMFAPQKAVLWSIVALLIVAAFRKETRVGLKALVSAAEDTIRAMLMIATAVAAVGIIIASITLTGVGTALAGGLVDLTGGHLWLLLPLVAVTCYIMGMGMTSLPIYMLLAILVAPAMVKLGVPVLAAHLFIVWWGVTSFITPPVALCAFAAASISGGDTWKTGFETMRVAAATYIVPFAFVQGPALLLIGTTIETVVAIVSASIGIAALAAGLQGWLLTKAGWPERVLFISGAVFMIFQGLRSDVIGLCVIAAALVLNVRSFRKTREGLTKVTTPSIVQ